MSGHWNLFRCILLVGFVCAITGGCRRSAPPSNDSLANPGTADVWDGVRILEYRPSGVTMSILKGWDFSTRDLEVKMVSPDKELTVMMYASQAKTFADATKQNLIEVARFVEKPDSDGLDQEFKIEGGLTGISDTGTGIIDGNKVGWGATLVDAPTKPFQLIWYFPAKGIGRDADIQALRLMLNNIRTLTNVKRGGNVFTVG